MAEPLILHPVDRPGIVTVMARKGVAPSTLGAALGLSPPDGPGAAFAGSRTVIATGPGTWLVLDDHAGADFAGRLAETLAGIAAVSDQSGSYLVHALSGPAARALLQRGLAIDLHPDAFGPGSAAISQIAHIGVVLWQVDDAPTYRIAVWRSYAESFRHWLEVTAVSLDEADQGG
ncbi:sarcosine oxidase subunit gamma [Novosphingobium colocasiae]|uniref:sarcosine oxidase subunit gamma n=1 Tax=Novosphingobium colocasiae TaxID=1256513 RepID=UPI0035AF0B78